MITHISHSHWGDAILIMEEHGRAFARVYWYYDDLTTIYLDMLSVSKKYRKQGLGTKLQEMREAIGRKREFRYACLFVKKDTWMHEWYKRRGYEDICDHESEEDMVWMQKILTE